MALDDTPLLRACLWFRSCRPALQSPDFPIPNPFLFWCHIWLLSVPLMDIFSFIDKNYLFICQRRNHLKVVPLFYCTLSLKNVLCKHFDMRILNSKIRLIFQPCRIWCLTCPLTSWFSPPVAWLPPIPGVISVLALVPSGWETARPWSLVFWNGWEMCLLLNVVGGYDCYGLSLSHLGH